MLRAVRFAATLGFAVDPATRAAIAIEAPLAGRVSGERTFAELMRLLAAERPSIGLRLAEETGLLAVLAPELARQRGVPQAKIPGEDLWDHTWRTVDAAAPTLLDGLPLARTAALLHDVGKPATFADGHFVGHETIGAELAAAWLDRLRAPRAFTTRVAGLVRHHMFAYAPEWSDAAIRRFIRRVGLADLDELLDLRAADNVGSGLPSNVDDLDVLRQRCRAQVAAHVALERRDLVVDGDDLMRALALGPGPALGRLLDELLERVLVDPMLNERGRLLAIARQVMGDAADAAAEAGRRRLRPAAPRPRPTPRPGGRTARDRAPPQRRERARPRAPRPGRPDLPDRARSGPPQRDRRCRPVARGPGARRRRRRARPGAGSAGDRPRERHRAPDARPAGGGCPTP